jgi:protein dithiol oxidoreductase (disulfide-forming)
MKRRDMNQALMASSAGWLALGLGLEAAPEAALAQGAKYAEGIDYLSLDKRVPTDSEKGRIEVVEFFWFNCPHCNAFEPRLEAWIKTLPKDVDVRRVPVRFRDDFEPQQRMYYVLESLGLVDSMQAKVFKAIHTEHQNLQNFDNLAAWSEKNGIPRAKFTELYNSFAVVSRAKRAAQQQEAFKVQGVPALGIAGRFYTDGTLVGNMDKALQVTEFLIAEVRKGR